MSERERKLLMLFGAAGVILLALWGYKSYENLKIKVAGERRTAEALLRGAQENLADRDSILDEIEWLAEHEPEPQAEQEVPSKLQQLAQTEAVSAGLTVKKPEILADRSAESETQGYYKVAQVKFTVTGEEKSLYNWFDRMHSPDDFRVISEITLSPNREDDSKIDCIVTFDQWFVPLDPNL